ncbi:MAG: type II secretion system F family protein [Acidimicrobiales bacterium]
MIGVRRRDTPDRELPELLETVARFLRSGSSLTVALREASEALGDSLRRDLAIVLAGADHGRPLAESFAEWAGASNSPARQMVAAAMVIAHTLGGGAAHTFDALASSLRARASAQREAEVMAAQARASALVIGVAPFAFALVIAAVDPSIATAVVQSSAGQLCLVGGIASEIAGLCWIRRLSGTAR